MAVRAKARRSVSSRRPAATASKSTTTRSIVKPFVKASKSASSAKSLPSRGDKKPHANGVAAKPAAPVATGPLASPALTRALKVIESLTNYENLRIVRYNTDHFDLNRMRQLCKKLGNPQDSLRLVHIAGTKGKGSTSAMTAAMLEAQGYRVGLYTSPHLVDPRERISINGQLIAEEDFIKLIKLVEPIVKKQKPIPTYFDVLTAIAFKYFADQKVDIAIIETGLGGRLDSTNIIKPEVTAITSISFDHMQQLGNTLAKIAGEKAGIFKPGVPAVVAAGQVPEVEAVFKRVAGEVGAPLDLCGSTIEFSYRFEASRMGGRQYRVCLTTSNSKFEHITVPLYGEHQAINCGLAMAIIDRLKSRGLPIDDQKAMEGLAKTRILGRMEMISQTPRIMIDAAHNAASIDAFMRAVGQHVTYDSLVVIFGCCGDKDVDGMLGRITSGADKVIFCPVQSIRTANPHELAMRYTENYGKMAQVASSLKDALEIAARAVTKEDLICITGSFYLIGEAKKMIQGANALANVNQPAMQVVG
jgi:dihydrofolate synthase/folylpolyglutamate synthase